MISTFRSQNLFIGTLGVIWIMLTPVTVIMSMVAGDTHGADKPVMEQSGPEHHEADKPKEDSMLPTNPEEIGVVMVLLAWMTFNERRASARETKHEKEVEARKQEAAEREKKQEQLLAEERTDRQNFLKRLAKIMARQNRDIRTVVEKGNKDTKAFDDLFREVRELKDCKNCAVGKAGQGNESG